MKKAIAAAILSALMLVAMTVTVSAHGHGRGGNATVRQSYALCTVENCHTTGAHYHNGTAYSGHYMGDGHDYHQECPVSDCTLAGSHEHGQGTCLPHNGNYGQGYNGRGYNGRGCH